MQQHNKFTLNQSNYSSGGQFPQDMNMPVAQTVPTLPDSTQNASFDIEIKGSDCMIKETKMEYIQKCNDRNALNEMIAKIRYS